LGPPGFVISPGGGVGFSWLILALAGAVALAIAVYAVRYLRDPRRSTGG
jgi:hypothetical protein